MRDYKRNSVYHLLDQLAVETYTLVREFAPGERSILGYPMLQAITGATTAIIHGCLSRNSATLLPYVERSHALTEELAQHLRLAQRLGIIRGEDLQILIQRQQSCSRLLLQWRQTIVLNDVEESRLEREDEIWAVAEELPVRKPRQRSK